MATITPKRRIPMAEEAQDKIMTTENTAKKVAFMSKPYTQEERIKKDEEELALSS
tara:strand:+ start:393 stop:557 length:165 start_codon:yes stop_codon:yes gene_type:complete